MIRVEKIRGLLAEKNISQTSMAKILGITPKTFYLKMAKGVFDSDEISTMIEVLDIENPTDIFFAQNVTQ